MNFSGTSGRCGGWLVVMAVFALGFSVAHAGGQGDNGAPATPASPVIVSNLADQINPAFERLKSGGLKPGQDDLSSLLQGSAPAVDSMQGVLSLPMPSSVLQQQQSQSMSRRSRELLDQRKNWAFSDMNELYPDPNLDDTMKDLELDGQNTGPVSAIERYYDRQGRKSPANTNQNSWQTEGWYKHDFTGNAEFNALGKHFSGDTNSAFAKSLYGISPQSEDLNPNAAGPRDVNGFLIGSPEDLAWKRHREEFGRLLDPNQVSAPDTSANGLFRNELNNVLGTATPAQNNLTAVKEQPHHSVLYPTYGSSIADPNLTALHSSVYDDPTATALGLPNPKPTTIQQPTTPPETVQQMLDPFKANLAKPRF